MIPDAGLPLSCRRCKADFQVDLPAALSDPALHSDDRPEPTTVGLNPFADLDDKKGGAALGPGVRRPEPRSPEISVEVDPPANLHEVTTVGAAPVASDLSVAPEVTTVDSPPQPDAAETPVEAADAPPEAGEAPPEPGLVSETNPSLALSPSDPAPQADFVSTAVRSSNLPTERAPPPAELVLLDDESLLGPLARPRSARLERSPRLRSNPEAVQPPPRWRIVVLAVPVAVGLTILALGLARSGSRTMPSVERAATESVAKSTAPAAPLGPPGLEPRAGPGGPSMIRPVAGPPKTEAVDSPDVRYVQIDRLRVRSFMKAKAPPVARLDAGRSVRVIERHRRWCLVMVEPDGPVGFVRAAALGATVPLIALAKERAFDGCRVTRRVDRRRCLVEARSAQAKCDLACLSQPALGPERCKAACQLAFDRCANDCRARRRR